ncbi:MAG: nitronate monooxygenase family protein [Candidatus Daviesbacteria bacterium]
MDKESKLPSLKFGQYEINVPIFQGGMSVDISGTKLALAVSKCGGAGTIGGVGRCFVSEKYQTLGIYEADRLALRDELQKAKDIDPHGIYGVNILVAVTDYNNLVQTAVDNGAKFIVSGAGLPKELPNLTANHPEIALIPIVSSVQGVRIMIRLWQRYKRIPDAIIIEEPATAGGHLGVTSKQNIDDPDLKLEFVIPEARKYLEAQNLEIPLIAAGGIWDRADINRMLKLGASGVQMATRFVTTPECDAPPEFKQKYLDAKKEDIIIIQSPVGIPGRAIKTNFLEQVEKGEIQDVCQADCLKSCVCRDSRDSGEKYCIIQALANARKGKVEEGIVFAGSNAWRSKEQGIIPVSKIFEELTS